MISESSRRKVFAIMIAAVAMVLALGIFNIGYASISSTVSVDDNSITADSMTLDIMEYDTGEWVAITAPMSGTTTTVGSVSTYTVSDYALGVQRPDGDTSAIKAWVIINDPLSWFIITGITLKVYDSTDSLDNYTTYNIGVGANDTVNLYSDPIVKSTGGTLPDGNYRFELSIQYQNTLGFDNTTYNNLVSGLIGSKLVFVTI